jgi:hypothetical protein
VKGTRFVRTDGRRQWLAIPPAGNAALVAAVAGRQKLEDISLRERGIEDVITRLYAPQSPPALDPTARTKASMSRQSGRFATHGNSGRSSDPSCRNR